MFKVNKKDTSSSNINEVIRSVLNCFLKHKTAYSEQQKNVYKKHLSSNINEFIRTI